MTVLRKLILLATALVLVCTVGVAWAATFKSGTWKGRGKAGNVCITFKVKGSKVTSLRVKGAPDCGYRFRCTGRLDRSAPPVSVRSIRIAKKTGRFVYSRKLVRQPPGARRPARTSPGARGMGATVKGKLKGSKATGTFRSYFAADGAGRCDSGTLSWKATVRR